MSELEHLYLPVQLEVSVDLIVQGDAHVEHVSLIRLDLPLHGNNAMLIRLNLRRLSADRLAYSSSVRICSFKRLLSQHRALRELIVPEMLYLVSIRKFVKIRFF
jgi:hypothetical protein